MVSLGHLLNDMFQSVIPAIYPMLKEALGLSFLQIGAITLTNQLTSSLLQPLLGIVTYWLPNIKDGITYLQSVLRLRTGEALR